ncbi:adhesion G-protein coupled receptor G5-like isoform X2 [Polyodon spathula]|uniref:adhesion G-protein coupled receptor G5-like isoform X2 n=1 Tax=Polyodon spathula TaxID=7913 RepID=UPI001B7F0543|nr:adhesion G-protein coupled receptor G5-like isoform X2 [Polyodon spathula]
MWTLSLTLEPAQKIEQKNGLINLTISIHGKQNGTKLQAIWNGSSIEVFDNVLRNDPPVCTYGDYSCYINCTQLHNKTFIYNITDMETSFEFSGFSLKFNLSLASLSCSVFASSSCEITLCECNHIDNKLENLENESGDPATRLWELTSIEKECPGQLEHCQLMYKYTQLQTSNLQHLSDEKFEGTRKDYNFNDIIILSVNKINVSEEGEMEIPVPMFSSEEQRNFTPKITLPTEAILKGQQMDDGYRRVTVILYNSSTQFETQENMTVVSLVINIAVIQPQSSISNLTTPVKMYFPLYNISKNHKTECLFYDETTADSPQWSDKGCQKTSETEAITVCSCNHMTAFAVLMVPINGIDLKNWEILSVISYIGSGLSAAFTAISVLMYFIIRNHKQDHSTTIHVCLSAALYLLNMSFLLNEWLANMNQDVFCKAIAILMHYFLLCCFSWMAVEAIHLYLLMIKVFNTYIRHYIAKLSLLGWGIPFIIIGISVCVRNDFYGSIRVTVHNSTNPDSKICWITNHTFFYALNLCYFAIIFLFNTGILITVAAKIAQLRRFGSPLPNRRAAWKDVFTVFGMFCLLGTTWGLAFLGFGIFTIPVLYLFSIFNSLQGLFIFMWIYASRRSKKLNNHETTKTTNTGREPSALLNQETCIYPGVKLNPCQ